MLQYNFTIQQQIGQADLVSVGYAGSRGNNLVGILQYNTPFAFYNGRSYEIPTNAQLISQYGATQPNNKFSDINYFGPFGDSWYSSLQVSYQRRFAAGLQTQLSYTFGKTTSTNDTAQAANPVNTGSSSGLYAWDRRTMKGLSGYHIKNSLTLNYSYDLPLGRGTSGVASKMLSGWRTTGVLSLRSGHPGTVSTGLPTALNDINVPGRVPNTNPSFTGKLVLGTPSDGQGKYFDRNAFQYNTATGLGARELGNLGRNTLIGPGSITWNPGLFKSFVITERTNLEFRTEFFNALNRPNYSFPAATLTNASGTPSGTAGNISSTVTTSRQIQFALKLNW
jgi:hypothetical protein